MEIDLTKLDYWLCFPVLVPQMTGTVPLAEVAENRASMQFVTLGVVDDSGWLKTNLSKSRRIWQIALSGLQIVKMQGDE